MDGVTPLRVDAVHFGYRKAPVLEGVSLRVERGDGVALLGANGAGKTTLTRLAMALEHPGAGRVVTGGRDTARRSPEDLADVAGYLGQHPEAQLFARTVHDEIAFGPRELRWPEARVLAAVERVLTELALVEAAARHPYDLPAPMRRLVALATALVSSPALLILDEPTAGLDREARNRVAEVVLARRAAGTAVLAVTHDLGWAAAVLDRAVVLDRGRVVHEGPMVDLLGTHPLFPTPPLVDLARRLGIAGVRPSIAALAPRLTSRPPFGTLQP